MEKISDILRSISDRLSSPLISSFIFAWLLFNWRVPVALIWLNAATIKNTGYSSVFDLIICVVQGREAFLYPFLSAVGYVLLIPPIKVLIEVFNARINRWGTGWVFKITKESNISTAEYFNYVEKQKEEVAKLGAVIREEGVFKERYKTAQEDIQRLNLQHQNELERRENETAPLRNDSRILKEVFDEEFMNGTWEVSRIGSATPDIIYTVFGSTVTMKQAGKSLSGNIQYAIRDTRHTERIFIQFLFRDDRNDSNNLLISYTLSKDGSKHYTGSENGSKTVEVIKV